MPVDGSGVPDAEGLEEGVGRDHLAEGAGQSVDARVGEVADAGQLPDDVADPLAGLDVGRVEAEVGEAEGQPRHRGCVGASVVVEDDDDRGAGVAEVVQGLVGHPAGEGPVADHGHHPPLAALELEGAGQAVGVAENGRGVAVLHPVVLGLGPVGIAREPVGLAELGERVAPSGDQLVHVGLVPGVPQEDVTGGVEGAVEGQGQFHHAQVGAQVSAGGRDGVDDERTDLGRQGGQLLGTEGTEVGGAVYVFEDHGRVMVPFRRGYQRAAPGPLFGASGSTGWMGRGARVSTGSPGSEQTGPVRPRTTRHGHRGTGPVSTMRSDDAS